MIEFVKAVDGQVRHAVAEDHSDTGKGVVTACGRTLMDAVVVGADDGDLCDNCLSALA